MLSRTDTFLRIWLKSRFALALSERWRRDALMAAQAHKGTPNIQIFS